MALAKLVPWGFIFGIPSFFRAFFAESHVVSSIVDDLYVVDGSIGIPIKGIRLENYDPICVFIDLIIYIW